MQLKNTLKKDDLVVCIVHDHGSRYVGKIYNDQWMMERGFLEVKTFRDIVSARGNKQKLISVSPEHSVSEAVALMRKYEIEHIPVILDDEVIGSVSENGLFRKLFSDGEIKTGENIENYKFENIYKDDIDFLLLEKYISFFLQCSRKGIDPNLAAKDLINTCLFTLNKFTSV
jgi:predicted transcriptional regulator